MRKMLIVLGATSLGTSSAIAQQPVVVKADPVPTKVVSYADLNIASKAGQARLVHRIRAAASDICLENNKEDVEFTVARRGCYKTAVSSGLEQMSRAIAARESGTFLAAATLTIQGR